MPVKEDRSVGWTKRSAAVSLLLAMENYRRETGLRVVRLREQNGWTQEDLAHAADVSVKTISRLENGRHDGRRSTIERVAKALGVDETALLGKTPVPLGLGVEPGTSVADLLVQMEARFVQRFDELSEELAGLRRQLPPEERPPDPDIAPGRDSRASAARTRRQGRRRAA